MLSSQIVEDDPTPRGHSVEVRLYAEDPTRDYQPQSGLITRFEIPHVVSEFANPTSYGIRLDSGVGAGDEIVLAPVAGTRSVGKADLPLNDALPRIEVEPDTFTVRIDGEVVEPEPVTELPMAQRYFLF